MSSFSSLLNISKIINLIPKLISNFLMDLLIKGNVVSFTNSSNFSFVNISLPSNSSV